MEFSICPICDRELVESTLIDEHHLIPKSKGGKYTEKILIHRVCHDKIHSTWTEKELADYYHTVERIRSSSLFESFLVWIKKKPPEFYARTKSSARKKK